MIHRLNHVVLYVRDAAVHRRFYEEVLGFEANIVDPAGAFVFLRAPGSDNHHDLAVFTVGADATESAAGKGSVGMYHLAWEVSTLAELADVRDRLVDLGILVGASDHGVNKSLYARDPDGMEFEVMWLVPREHWGDAETSAVIEPLDIDAEIRRFGSDLLGRSSTP